MSGAGTCLALHHVALRVTDLDRAIRFYRDLLKLDEVAHLPGEKALLKSGPAMVTLWPRASGPAGGGRAGLDHLAFEVADAVSLDAVRDRLEINAPAGAG